MLSSSLRVQVLVMEAGVVKEFDSVPRLMGRSESTFKSMVIEAGLEGAASGAISRIASQAALAAVSEEGGEDASSGSPGASAAAPAPTARPKLEGMKTFVQRMKTDYDLK